MGDEHMVHRFDSRTRVVLRESTIQREHLESVASRIGAAVRSFFADKPPGTEYVADDLRRHVSALVLSAPYSARRVASEMKNRHEINFKCINRAKSLYMVIP